MLTSSAPDDDLHMGRRRAAERRGWAAVGFHQRSLRCPDRAESQARPRCRRAADARREEFELDDVAPVIELAKELIRRILDKGPRQPVVPPPSIGDKPGG